MSDERDRSPQQLRETGEYEIVDVYVTYNVVEAQLIHDILADNDIHSFTRNLEPSQFPISVGKHGQHRISVEDFKADSAVALLKQARADNAITDEGSFLYGDEAASP